MARAQLSADLEHAIVGPRVRPAVPADRRDRDAAGWSASRRSCAGSIPSAAGSARTTSSGSPRSPTRSSRSAAGCSSQACRQVRAWHDLVDAGSFTMSVNISARQLAQPDFVDEVLTIIREAGVEPAEIVLEMTETSMLQDSAATRAKLQDLRDAGIGVSIDDFGTGYSSLSYLQRFPVTTLKIARDFVDVDGHRRRRVGARQRHRGPRPGAASCRSSPKASSSGRSSAACGRSAASSPRASTSRGRSTRPSIESLLAHGGVLSGDPDSTRRWPTCVRSESSRPADRSIRARPRKFRFPHAPTGTFVPLARRAARDDRAQQTTAARSAVATYGLQTRQTRRKAGTQSQGSSGSPLPKDRPAARHRTSARPKVVSMLQVDRPDGGAAPSDAHAGPTVAGASTSPRPVASARP